MLNKNNPNHVYISEIYKTAMDTYSVSFLNEAKVIPQLLMFTIENLSNMDYMIIGLQYEEFLTKEVKMIK